MVVMEVPKQAAILSFPKSRFKKVAEPFALLEKNLLLTR